jgi:hypothetical protein
MWGGGSRCGGTIESVSEYAPPVSSPDALKVISSSVTQSFLPSRGVLAGYGIEPVVGKRVVDGDVEGSESLRRRLDYLLDRRLIGDVGSIRERFAAVFPDESSDFLRLPRDPEIIDDHGGAFSCQTTSYRGSDAAAGAGNERDLAFENAHNLLPPPVLPRSGLKGRRGISALSAP